MYDDITNEIAEAFNTDLADAVSSFVAKREITENYNPSTGDVEEGVFSYSGRGIFSSYSLKDIDGTLVLQNDQKLIALQADVTAIPEKGDIVNGLTVISISKDPANTTWTIQLRA